MRQLLLAAGVLCASALLAHWAAAQNQTAMPGQAVGSTFKFQPVGSAFPQAGTKLGQPLNLPQDSALMRRTDLNNPFDGFRGTQLNPKNVIAPVPGAGNALERFYDKMKAAVGIAPKAPPPRPNNVTPGIFRRNRERAKEMMWRRD